MNSLQQVKDLIDAYTAGLPLSEEFKTSLVGLCIIKSAKETLEALFAVKSDDPHFYQNLRTFFQENIASLPKEDQEKFSQILAETHTKVMVDILKQFAQSLPEENQKTLIQNITRLHQKQTESVSSQT